MIERIDFSPDPGMFQKANKGNIDPGIYQEKNKQGEYIRRKSQKLYEEVNGEVVLRYMTPRKDSANNKQNSVNEVNINDIAYIKGLLYALVNRVGRLESARKEDIASGKEQANESANNSGGSSGNKNEDGAQNEKPEPEENTNQCFTRATFSCNSEGSWQKGAFQISCTDTWTANGWVQNGDSVEYTAIDGTSENCSGSGLDTDCSLKLYGTLLQNQAPDSMLEYVKKTYQCSSEESESTEYPNGQYTVTIKDFDCGECQDTCSGGGGATFTFTTSLCKTDDGFLFYLYTGGTVYMNIGECKNGEFANYGGWNASSRQIVSGTRTGDCP